MDIWIVSVAGRRGSGKGEPMEKMVEEYVRRIRGYGGCEVRSFASEEALLEGINASKSRAYAVLCDSRGEQMTSEEFAERLGRLRDGGIQRVALGIGPADGWSREARERANLWLSLGKMTLPHQLAKVVLVEQVYRALTILGGHPYHSGH